MHKKILGICFGHQVLCRALGGKVRRANGGWDIGLRKVMHAHKTTQCLLLLGSSHGSDLPSCISIIEYHQDEVCEVPLCGKVIACPERHGWRGIQGHPEYSKDIMCNLIQRLLDNKSIEKECADQAIATMEAAEADRMFWEKVCKRFLKGVVS